MYYKINRTCNINLKLTTLKVRSRYIQWTYILQIHTTCDNTL